MLTELEQLLRITMLYRSTAARSVLRAIAGSNVSVARSTFAHSAWKAQLTTSTRPARLANAPSLALAARKPVTTALVRYASATSKVKGTCLGADTAN